MQGIADYEFVRSLGSGNHGEFFLARCPERLPVDAEHVAVKVLGGGADGGVAPADVFRRATRELRSFAAVSSPHLVRLYDAGQQSGVVYYSMEYLPGGSLADPAEPLDRETAVRAVADAARAAQALHDAGIVHRDIHPRNVLLYDGGAKLSDLGLSQVMAPGMTLTGMGSPESVEYVDPALLYGDPPSPATDVYALGVTLHRAVTGVGLYGDEVGGDPMRALRRVLSSSPVVSAELPAELADLVRSCIGPVGERPTAGAVAAALG